MHDLLAYRTNSTLLDLALTESALSIASSQCLACSHSPQVFDILSGMQHRSPVNDKHFECGAQFSRCRTYRYTLWRRWDWRGYENQLMFIGLNPSTADETQDDPTVRRCIRFAKDWGYSGLIMMNAFGFRATDPKVMAAASNPVGPGNDRAFRAQRSRVGMVVAAWGNHCSVERAQRICKVINGPIHCLATNKSGQPKHPLYIAAKTKPKLYWSPDQA